MASLGVSIYKIRTWRVPHWLVEKHLALGQVLLLSVSLLLWLLFLLPLSSLIFLVFKHPRECPVEVGGDRVCGLAGQSQGEWVDVSHVRQRQQVPLRL